MGLPSSGGITTLQTLGILENFSLEQAYSARDIHIILEAQKLAYADRNHYLADDDIVLVPSAYSMLDKEYLKQRAGEINAKVASKIKAQPGAFEIKNGQDNSFDAPSTTHISIIDKEGNAVSLTSSVEHSFGSGIIVDGFILNNQLTDFAFKPEQNGKPVANAVASKKRPRSSMSPTMIFNKDGSLYAVLGSPGGSSIIAYVTKVIIGLIDWNMSLQEVINSPNFMHKNTKAVLEGGQNELHGKLVTMGHDVSFKKATSGVNAILITNDGSMVGASDPRREGIALGY